MTEALQTNELYDNAKRQQILDGARRCFVEQGFDGASMNDIVKSAGVSKGTVYAYFPSKEKLFEALVFQDRRRQAEQTIYIGDESRPIETVLYDLGLRMSRLITSDETIAYTRMIMAVAAKFPDVGSAFYEAGPAYSISQIAPYLKRKMEDGTLEQTDPEHAAMQYAELVHCGLLKPKLFASPRFKSKLTLEEAVEAGVKLFLRGLSRK
jgi:AcrR family transcriptional regulator